jgi:hypothetical protein
MKFNALSEGEPCGSIAVVTRRFYRRDARSQGTRPRTSKACYGSLLLLHILLFIYYMLETVVFCMASSWNCLRTSCSALLLYCVYQCYTDVLCITHYSV